MCKILDTFITRHNIRFHKLVDAFNEVLQTYMLLSDYSVRFVKILKMTGNTFLSRFTKIDAVFPLRAHDPYSHVFLVSPNVEFVTKRLIFCSPSFYKWLFVKTEISGNFFFFFFSKDFCCCTLH
jgi:hypothetical protein